ncbi:laminin subunit alpha-3 isoform X1 [Coregonus clupeaformis]|uniref:laminin subunit alpha-3 isoform X1 n=1 Tax=Coregonus clupeaformis TaxID=59861 RepID=UPI001E1C2F83|nr:laminin subunit alpha-3 isoform X1 [Coregonus clupeaformis]
MARGMKGAHPAALLCTFTLLLWGDVYAQLSFNEITGFSLSPPYFNLAEGSRISATATCGQDETGRPRSDLYCKLVGGPTFGLPSQTIQGQYCDRCNSNEPNKAHPVSNAIDGTERWWQSPPLSRGPKYNEVNVTLNLGQLFHVAYVLIKFANAPRPDLWVLERSLDHGKTYAAWQYFAHSKRECIERFGKQPNGRIVRDDDQICTTEYSKTVPLENGEIVVSLVNGRPGSKNFTYSPVLRDFTKATNIRLHFLRTSTLLGHLISKAQRDPTVTRRYYYSIKDISVGGRCVCHGHAQVCGGRNQGNPNRLQCECKHNTCGESCDRCCPGFNQKPWRAATTDSPNECQPCQCHSHATECYYDSEVEQRAASLDTFGSYNGGGVCITCQHNTAGVNCELCADGFYRPHGVPPQSHSGCIPCRCDARTTAGCEIGTGRCRCRPEFTGNNCERCADGYYGYPQCIRYPIYQPTTKSPAGHIVGPTACPAGYFGPPSCQQCLCDRRGSVLELCDASGRCMCREGVEGQRCDRCRPGHHTFPNCQVCRCDGAGVTDRVCGPNRQCRCRANYIGQQCDQCAPGYYGYPDCSFCQCSGEGSYDPMCNPVSGQCLCRPGVVGQQCDRCAGSGLRFPQCSVTVCRCDGAGVTDRVCGPNGQCHCHANYVGQQCDQCAPGYYGYPDCATCQCSGEGSYDPMCNPVSGQCLCRPGVVGQQCDHCAGSGLRFPQCSAFISQCNPAGSEVTTADPQTGSCGCLPNVDGTLCDTCKPLYWNLATENPSGCIECHCDVKGTLSGVGECQQKSGQCFCKPNVCSHTCDTCKEGYYLLQKRNYFGCQGCQCDVGGAISRGCDEMSGQCQCRKNIVGRTCNEPAPNYYFPSLHHVRYEVEDGITPNARPVRFGYDPQEFPEFSWRGYAIMSPAQPEVILSLAVGFPGPFHIVFRYITPTPLRPTQGWRHRGRVRARILVVDEPGFHSCCDWSGQSKEVVFPPSASPAYLTVPGDGFAELFSLTPGKWIIRIRAEGLLLDYLVLLPSDYYEAPVLQEKITQPCTYTSTANRDANCLLYKHVAMDRLSSVLGSQGQFSSRRRRRRRQARVRRPTPDHPDMASLTGRQAQLQLNLRVSRPGPYILVLEYASEVDTVQNVNLIIIGQSESQIQARANIYSCQYSFLCRSVVVDGINRMAVFQFTHKAKLLLQTSTASLLLYKVYAVPAEEFSMDYVDPKVLCVSVHGRFTEDSQYCVPSQYDRPSSALVLDAARDGRLSSHWVVPQQREIEEWRQRRQSGAGGFPLPGVQSEGVLLKSPQTEISFSARVAAPGRYVFVVHYCQPEHTTFPVEVRVDAGHTWTGFVNASFCPGVSCCREVVIAERRIALDLPQQDVAISLKVPPGKTLTLDYILVVPDDSYTPDLLKEKPLDKSSDFTRQCEGQGFFIDSRTSSQFCQDSARSLVAAYSDGALPCYCDKSGATGPTCNPVGGQCPCRPHVIGRQCTRCATGYYGFPYCKPCDCGQRLCHEVTGQCICPPQTVKPACDVCESQTFSYHPLVGCEGCDCSPNGVKAIAGRDCDRDTGRCMCKPRIGGRQCDRCAAGFYRFPECLPCNCNQGGVTPDICHPDTGQCLCKRNVQGAHCDACRDGSFHFDPSHPRGCISCFCFGANSQCQSSGKRRGKFVDMRGWRLERADQEEVASVLNPSSNTVVADVQELPGTTQLLHWVAPPSYLGDRVSSYGGYLTYQAKSFGIPSEGMSLMDRRPDVLLSGQEMALVHMAPKTPDPDRLHQGRVQLVEGNWRHAGTNRPVSREDLMVVLAGLVGLRVRALYFTQSQRLSLGEVGLEEATDTGAGGPASTVEQCACSPLYRGDSCQKCATGYYRDGSGPYLGRCVPCSCNGLANECDERTGRCLNCQYSTAGDRCERCKEGYYGDAAQRSCQVCPCPFSVPANSFAVGCREAAGGFQCVCKQGYTGDRCERCAPGYYGDPLTAGGSCRPCDCNGNGNNCDSRTGVCKNTLEPGDTNTDEQCQVCDNCAQTLLNDLQSLDEELGRIKTQLDSASISASSQDRLRKLENAITETKSLVNKFSSSVNSLKPKVSQLEQETLSVIKDINALKGKADDRAVDAQTVLGDVDKTHLRAKDLDTEAKNLLKKILALLQHLKESGSSGGGVPNENLAKMLSEAERMVKEMEKRNFNPQKDAAEKEKDEAQKLLDYIKANVTKQYDQNEAAANRVKGLLKDYEAKLKDLEEALKLAGDMVKKANTQNGLNTEALEDILKRMEDLKKERKKVQDQIAMAEDQLKDTKYLLRRLDDSKTEYEHLAAQLDGARTDLTKKVNDISQAAAKEDIVERAEKHAENLAKLAKELQDAVRDSSGRSDVRDAMDAIKAYKNITDAVNAAEKAAKEAKDAADKALKDVKKEDLTKRAKNLKDSGNDLLRNAEDAEKDLKEVSDDLTAQKKRLKDAEKKKKALEKDLMDAQAELNNIMRDDIGEMLDEAKREAASANDTASTTMDRLNAIREEVDKINVMPSDSNLSSVMDDVDKSVRNLLNTIPSLQDKILEVEELSSQLSPVTNISENIKRIKELIEQSRDAANRVVVPMKFSGEGHVELRPPRDMEDLKAYTALSLSLQRPVNPDIGRGDGTRRRRQDTTTTDKGDMFVLYLGNQDSSKDYIGMALRKNVLFCVYKLSGEEYEIKTDYITRSLSEPAFFDKVDLHRIYQDAQVILTKLFTSNEPDLPQASSKQGELTRNLLNLDPSDVVFYVGGYPAQFTPPASLNYPNYKGCIELSTFNDRFISLYNFKKAVKINLETPCKRYVQPVVYDYFEGTGYAKVSTQGVMVPTLLLSQTISTRSENGLLLYIGNEDNYYSVTFERGYVVIHSNLLREPARSTTKVFPVVADSAEVLIIMESKGSQEMKIRVATNEVVKANVQYTPGGFTDYYIGGLPQALREKHNITTQPLKGCMKNVKLNSKYPTFQEKVGISRGCPKDFLASRKAEFNVGSSLSAALKGFSLANDVTVSLGFKSSEKEGLLLQNTESSIGAIELALVDGYVVLTFKDEVWKSWKSSKQYQDGKWHYLTATRRVSPQSITLRIDEDDMGGQITLGSFRSNPDSVFLGKDTFKGCLSNLYLRRPESLYIAEDLSQFSSTGDVLLDMCNADRPPQLMLDRNTSRKDVGMEVSDDSLSVCAHPALVKHAYHIGGTVSSLSYSFTPQALQPRPHFSLDVRTKSAKGLLFYAATRGGSSHMALYLSKGRIRLSVDKRREIFNREKYNDGKWHSVIFSLEKKKFRLVVDGIRAQDGQLTSDEATSKELISPLYMGSAPDSLNKELKWKLLPRLSVIGCVRNFKMNGTPMPEPTMNHGAGPCFDGQAQSGAYFSGRGAYVIINDSFVVGSSFEVVFDIRPRSLTGVLLHAGDSSRPRRGPNAGHHLSLYMHRGEVVARVNNGAGEFNVSVRPKQPLCDGMFHRVAVIKRNNVVEMHVDTEGDHKIGPSSSSSTLTKDPLYVGGIPEMSMHLTLPVTGSFEGCIQNMKINEDPVSFKKLSGVFGPVNLRECPAG